MKFVEENKNTIKPETNSIKSYTQQYEEQQ